jgi:hypothetical protein
MLRLRPRIWRRLLRPRRHWDGREGPGQGRGPVSNRQVKSSIPGMPERHRSVQPSRGVVRGSSGHSSRESYPIATCAATLAWRIFSTLICQSMYSLLLVAKLRVRHEYLSTGRTVRVRSTECVESHRHGSIPCHKTTMCNSGRPIRPRSMAPSSLMRAAPIQQILIDLKRNRTEAMQAVEKWKSSAAIDGREFAQATVRDARPGPSGAVSKRLFEPFVVAMGMGMGIGLSICQSIVEARGGGMLALPNNRSGAAFRFGMPIVEQREAA